MGIGGGVWKSNAEVNPKVSRFDGVATRARCQLEQMEQGVWSRLRLDDNNALLSETNPSFPQLDLAPRPGIRDLMSISSHLLFFLTSAFLTEMMPL